MKELNTKGGTNRFKYSSFNDIIAGISIDVSHVIKKSKLQEEFYFKQGLIKWKELNASTDFKDFLKEINNYQSLVQLIHHQKEIVDILLKHLGKSGSLAVEPLLWLCVDLAKDLVQDFFPFYLNFLKAFADLLKSTQDPHLIQSIFTSIAWLFKINAKSLVKDIIPTFDVLFHLFNSKDYIQGFTAESFGFLVRKLDIVQLRTLFSKMQENLKDKEEHLVHGFGLFIIESIKHVQGNLHSKGLDILKEFYMVFSKNRLIMEHVAGLAQKSLSNEALSEVFRSLVDEILLHSTNDCYSICSMFSSATILLLYRNGRYLKDKMFLLDALSCLAKNMVVSKLSKEEKIMFLLFFSQSYSMFSSIEITCNFRDSITFIFELEPSELIFFCYILLHSSWKSFYSVLWEPLVLYLNKNWENNHPIILRFIGYLFSEKCSFLHLLMPARNNGRLGTNILSPNFDDRICQILDFGQYKPGAKDLFLNDLKEALTLADILSSFSITNAKVQDCIYKFFMDCSHHYLEDKIIDTKEVTYFASLIGKCLLLLSNIPNFAPDGFEQCLKHLFIKNSSNADILNGISAYLKFSSVSSHIFSDFDWCYSICSGYIYYKDEIVRLNTLKLLKDLEERNNVEFPVFNILLEIETTSNTIDQIRNKSNNIRRLETIYLSKNSKIVQDAIMKYLFAIYSINFTPLWEQSSKSLSVIAASQPTLFWNIFNQFCAHLRLDDQENDDMCVDDHFELLYTDIPFGMRQINEWKLLCREAYCYDSFSSMDNTRLNLNDCAIYQQILKVIEKTTNVSGRYAKDLVKLFMEHHKKHYLKYRPITFGYLSMFSTIRSLSNHLEFDSEFLSILLKMVTSGELKLQELSLNCLLLLKDESLKNYADYLREIISEDNFVETLSSFDDTGLVASSMLTEVISRILYGKMISKIGRNSKNLAKSRRKAIFGFLIKFQVILEPFVNLMVAPFASKIDSKFDRYEMGFLNILEDFIGQLQLFLTPNILTRLCDTLVMIGRHPELDLEIGVEEEDSEKSLRSICVKRWRQLFELDFEMDFSKYQANILDNLISHKIKNFAAENTQAPSALLLLCRAWAKNPAYTPWLFHDSIKDLVPNIVAIISEKKVKDSVISVVLSIIEELQKQCLESLAAENFVALQYRHIFPKVLLHSRNVLKASLGSAKLLPYQLKLLSIISEASLLGANSADCLEILEILFPYLKKPSKFFSEKSKIQILNIFINFANCIPQNQRTLEGSMHFRTIAQLYLSMESRLARQALSKAMNVLVSWDYKLAIVSELLESFNSYSEKRIDEPDYKRQMMAFSLLNNELLHNLDENQCLPIIYHLLFSIKSEDYATRNSAALSIDIVIKLAAESDKIANLVEFVILPTIKHGLKNAPETVRVEYARFIGLIVKRLRFCKLSEELSTLLGCDEETNFFSNIYHLQLHRRGKALRSLESLILEGKVSSSTVVNIFMPILHHFILESKGKDHNFTNEVVRLIGVCSRSLNWGHYSTSLNQYVQLLQKSTDIEKIIFRSILQVVENFHFGFTENITSSALEGTKESPKDVSHVPLLSARKLLGKLEDLFPSSRSDSAARVQIAYALSIIYKQLPLEEGKLRVEKIFSKLSTMLSNHVQDYRDNAREALAKIIIFWGSSVFPDAIKQLHLRLDRGYKKHILAYTLNWLLVRVIESISPAELDYVLETMVNICIDDIFGFAAEEKEVAELKSKFKEIKKSKSQDTLEILAGAISFKSLVVLLIPIKEVMMVITDSKSISILLETFRRISVGINSNKSVAVDELFPFIRELLTENLALSRVSSESKKVSQLESNFLVQMKRPTGKDPLKILASNAYLFIDFGLSLFLTFLKKDDSSNISLLDPFVDIMGSLIYSVHDSILSQVLKIWCIMISSRLPRLKLVAPVVLKRAIKIVTNSAALDSELSQMALRLLSILIREGHANTLSQNQIAAILSLLKPHLDEPNKQSFVFGIVQSIISTKTICDEVYDIMDEIMRNMIVNQTESIRNVCRFTFVKFILTYPHGQSKLDKLVVFTVKGLEYEYESGRLNILEVISDLIEKFSDAILAEYFEMIFMGLIMDIINDESSKCKEVASAVVKRLLLRASHPQLDKMITVINSWNENSSNNMLQRSSFQLYGIMIESCPEQIGDWKRDIVRRAACVLEKDAQNTLESALHMSTDDMDWIKSYYAISLLSKAMISVPDIAIDVIPIKPLKELLIHFHQWVRSISGKLFGQIFSYLNSAPDCHPVLKPLFSDGQFMLGLGKTFCLQLDPNLSDEGLTLQIVKNLVFVSKKLMILEQNSDEEFLSVLIKILSRKSRQEAAKSKNTLIQSSTLKWFSAISTGIARENMETHLKPVLEIIYRITTDETTKGDNFESLRNLAREAQSHLQTACDPQIYLSVYSIVKETALQMRNERKMERSIMAIANPEKHAKRKAQKNSMKRAQKKRKVEEYSKNKIKNNFSLKRSR